MADWNPEANAIFLEALDLDLAAQRRTFLDQSCDKQRDKQRVPCSKGMNRALRTVYATVRNGFI